MFVSCWVIMFNWNNMWCGFFGDEIVFVFFLVFDIQWLCYFCGGVVLDWQGYYVGFFIEVVYVYFREFFCDIFIDFLVVF